VLGLEQLAQPRDVRLERGGGVGRRGVAPELLDQAVGRDRLARVQQEEREQGPLFRPPETKRLRPIPDLERAEDQIVQIRAQKRESTAAFPGVCQAFVRPGKAGPGRVAPMLILTPAFTSMFNDRRIRYALFAATATVLLVALLGCGDDSDDGGPPPETADAAASAEEASLPKPISPAGAQSVNLSDRLVTQLEIPEGPDWLVSAFGSLWVKQDSGGVVRVDPETGKVIARVAAPAQAGGHVCQGMGASEDAVWACPQPGRITRIDPATNTLTATVRIDKVPDQGRLVGAADRLWVLTDSGATLTAIDPRDGKPATSVELGARCVDLAADGTTLWATCPFDNRVLRIDATTEESTGELDLAGAAIAAAGDHLWVAFEGGVAQIDPDALEVLAVYDVSARYGGAIFAGPDAVWVREEGGDFLTRIDPDAQRITETIRAPDLPSGGDVVQIGNSLWATAYDDATVVELRASGS
jgi:streptogramin lyase